LLELLHRIAPPVEPLIKRRPAPVILAAHPEVQGHFREIAGWKDIHPDGLSENPDAVTRDELHRRAYGILEQKRIEARNAAIDRLNARLGTGKATTRPEEIVPAGRGDARQPNSAARAEAVCGDPAVLSRAGFY
jgi:hypothetical protein